MKHGLHPVFVDFHSFFFYTFMVQFIISLIASKSAFVQEESRMPENYIACQDEHGSINISEDVVLPWFAL
jgi:hypothetical protein